MRYLESFVELKKILAAEQGLSNLHQISGASTQIYKCSGVDSDKTYILKKLAESSNELAFYRTVLPLISGNFDVLQLPELIETFFISANEVYILLPYYNGHLFDFHKPDEAMAGQMVAVVQDLMKVDVEAIIPNGSKFDYYKYESKFWQSFENAILLNLIPVVDRDKFREASEKILETGRNRQKMIISNGDFNPRNLIRLNGKLILIDWSHSVAPLEHHLTYPWLLNFYNPVYPNWQKKYATQFEYEIPVEVENIRYHLMRIALSRAVMEQGFYIKLKDENVLKRANNHMENFRLAIRGFRSLKELS